MSNHLALRSGNPALQSSTFRNHLSSVTDGTMTLSGTVNKTAISLVLVILSAAYSWTNPAMHGLVVPAALIGLVLAMGVPWDIALAAVFVEGLLFVGLSYAGARTAMINAIPKDLKIATMAGIGLFLTIIGMQNAGWIVDNPATLIDFTNAGTWTHESGQFWA